MKQGLLLLFVCLFASWSFAQTTDNTEKSEKKERKLILQVKSQDLATEKQEPQIQEQVEVGAEEFPGLNVSFQNPADSLSTYKPYTKQELQAYSDLLLDYKLSDYDRSETARPHKSGKIFQVRVPD